MEYYFTQQPIYDEPDLTYASILNAALSTMDRTREPVRYESFITWHDDEPNFPTPQDMARSMDEEEQIYNTPYEDEGNYGPIYYEPPSDEHKIYEEFEGKKFRKLYHEDIRLTM